MFRNGLQPAHLAILVVVLVLLFGASRLPVLARSVGQTLRIVKRELGDLADDPDRGGQGGAQPPPTAGGDDRV